MMRFITLALSLIVCLCLTQAQVPMTQAGKGTPGSPPAFTGLGDAVSQTVYGYWGVREYRASYGTGNAVKVCNVTTFATCTTVNYLSTGYVDYATAAATAACTGTGGCVAAEIFDSSGNAHHATCASAAACATVTFSCHGVYPCYVCAGACAYALAGSTAPTLPQTYSWVGQRQANFTTFGGLCCMQGFGLFFDAATNSMELYAGTAQNFTVSDSTWHSLQAVINAASTYVYLDGTQTTKASPGTSTQNLNTFGDVNGSFASFEMLEIAVYNTVAYGCCAGGTDANNANANQHAAYGGL